MPYPCLWFKNQAEEAVRFYTSLFKNSRIVETSYYPETGPGPAGSVLTITFELDGDRFMALNGMESFTFNHAISLVAQCENQAELDRVWDTLAKDGKVEQCGWLKDRYGVSWQVVPRSLAKMLTDRDSACVNRVMQAIMKMKKLDVAALEQAYGKTLSRT